MISCYTLPEIIVDRSLELKLPRMLSYLTDPYGQEQLWVVQISISRVSELFSFYCQKVGEGA